MKYRIKIIYMVMMIVLLIPLISYSHSGRTDSSGGHYDSFSGEYHYHHGYSAHQHPNGVCPYEEEDEEEDEWEGSIFTDTSSSTEDETGGIGRFSFQNQIIELHNQNKELRNEMEQKKGRINDLIIENSNLQKKVDTLYYIGIAIVVIALLYICYLLKKISKLKDGYKNK